MMVNSDPELPDYPLADRRIVVAPRELKAMAHPLRSIILDLVLERAATVTELAAALKRPKSTIAHHIAVLVEADMLKVVRTRRVRAIEERFYGRTARLFFVGEVDPADVDPPPWAHPLRDAMRESDDAYRADTMWANTRHVRISRDQASAFWSRVEDLIADFSTLARQGDDVFGLTVALYPTQFPTLPEPAADLDAAPDGAS
jgi:DNA-binding transcriptional ArsR family regulator